MIANFNSSEWKRFQHLFERREVPVKSILLEEGKVSRNAFYIEKGCVRVSFNNNGRNITFQFFFEGDVVSSIESFKTNQPSLFTIDCIEPCIIYAISQRNLLAVIKESAAIKQQMDDYTLERLIFYQKLFLSRIKDNPERRYLELLTNSPEILLRVPQHYIASFLGITSVSLSRIRNRR